jgi:alpha-galactosidase
MNRIFSEPGWPEAGAGRERELWVTYVQNLYDILGRLRAKHPELEIESCSGGGGRVDLGIMRYVDEFWTSDNTEAFDRLRIQEGFSEAYTAKYMSAWVTDVPNMNGRSTPLQYRFLVAMQGALGIGANLNKWTDEDSQLGTKMVALDKRIRSTVQFGNLYRLLSPRVSDTVANEYVGSDGKQAVVFAFRHSQQYRTEAPAIRLTGLEPRAVYEVDWVDGRPKETLSGAYLMEHGLEVRLRGDYDSTAAVLERTSGS